MEEKFYKEDYVTYLKSSFNVILGKLYLTEYSLVFEGTTNGLFVNKNLVIEIELNNIESIMAFTHGLGKKYRFKLRDNNEYFLMLNKAESWLSIIQEFIHQLNSNIKIKITGDLIEFSNNINESLISEIAYCTNCGNAYTLNDNLKYCTGCGNKLYGN